MTTAEITETQMTTTTAEVSSETTAVVVDAVTATTTTTTREDTPIKSVAAIMDEMNAVSDINEMIAQDDFPFPKTLYSQLAPYRYQEEQFFKEKGGVLFLVKRLLGCYPQTLSTFAIYMPLFAGYSALVPAALDIPRTDAGFGKISINLRRLCVTLTSMTAQCAYCTSHACGLGDAFRGGVMWRPDRSLKALPSQVNDNERVALRCVVAGTKVPARVTKQMRDDCISKLGVEGLQQVAQCAALLGYLNIVMDTLGSELEDLSYDLAKDILPNISKGWDPRRNRPTNRSHGYSKYQDPNIPDDNAPPNCCTSVLGHNILTDTIELLGHVRKAKADDSRMMAAIPNSHSGINDWLAAQFGVAPRFLKSIISLEYKRAVSYALYSFILARAEDVQDEESKPHLDPALKIRAAYVFFMAADNGLMATYIAALAMRRGIKASDLQGAVAIASAGIDKVSTRMEGAIPVSTPGPREGETFESHVLVLALATARRYAAETNSLAEHLLPLSIAASGVNGQEGARRVVELLGVLGTCNNLQRFSAITDDGQGLEDVIVKDVVNSEYGKELNLAALEPAACSSLYTRDGRDQSVGFNIIKSLHHTNTNAVTSAVGEDGNASQVEDLWGGNVEY